MWIGRAFTSIPCKEIDYTAPLGFFIEWHTGCLFRRVARKRIYASRGFDNFEEIIHLAVQLFRLA